MRIAGSGDLAALEALDTALWVATRAPIETLRADPQMLAMLDGDGDGVIRAGDLKAAVVWLLASLRDHSGIDQGSDAVHPDAIHPEGPDGPKLLDAARKLQALDPHREALTLAQVEAMRREHEEQGLGSAGLVREAAAQDEQVRGLIRDILATAGGSDGGVDDASLTRFLAVASAHVAWHDEGQRQQVQVFGADTGAIAAGYERLDPKLRQYFALSDALSVDPRLEAAALPSDEALAGLDLSDAPGLLALMEKAPLARPVAGASGLDLTGPLNPHHAEALEAMAGFLAQIDGQRVEVLTRERWRRLGASLETWRAWQGRRPAGEVGATPVDRLRGYLGESASVEALRALLERSHREALVTEELKLLERLLRYQRGVLDLANSFVSFPDLYDPTSRALFEMGTLVIDGRRLTMAVRVQDRERHARLSNASNMYVIYARISTREGTPLHEVAVPVTSGGRGGFQVGKHGLFEDVDGAEQLATIVHIVENPISLTEAIAAPFKRLGGLLIGRIEKWSQDSEAAFQGESMGVLGAASSAGAAAATQGATKPTAPPAAGAAPATGASGAGGSQGAAGVLAGGGIALAAVGSSVAFIVQTFTQMGLQSFALGMLALVVMVLLPVIIVAVVKLRRRDLSAILEGSGWGINARMYLTRAQARTFTFAPRHKDAGR